MMDPATRVEQQSGDIPAPRFGHTTTCVGNNKVVLFGGAVGDARHYVITSDAYMFDMVTFRWVKLSTERSPQPRAAHAAACVDSMQLVIFGGATGGGPLSSDDLYLLDLRKEPHYVWMIVPTTGGSPGRRYGHTLVYYRPNIVVFGGNDGQYNLNDVWFLDVEISPFCWTEVKIGANMPVPPARVYHSAEVCREGPANGMIVVFGGRSQDSKSLKDTWGLRQHRDGQWDWVEAPIKKGSPPNARFQHTAVFVGSKMLIIGGRTENDCTRSFATATYDTENVEWRYLPSIGRFRHSSWASKNTIFSFGGFSHSTQQHPVDELVSMDCSLLLEFYNEKEQLEKKHLQMMQQQQQIPAADQNRQRRPVPTAASSTSTTQKPTSASDRQLVPPSQLAVVNPPSGTPAYPAAFLSVSPRNATMMPIQSKTTARTYASDIRLSSHAHAVQDASTDFSSLVQRISIDRLEDEGKKINKSSISSMEGDISEEESFMLFDEIIEALLNPGVSQNDIALSYSGETQFCISPEKLITLCEETIRVFKEGDGVLQLRTPIKIYGDIHGQYYDLMRLFELYKSPVGEELSEELNVDGDLDTVDYLFLGDYVDRGTNSLEIITLLFALKCKYPSQVHLIRGNHEDSEINCIYGFQDECRRRLQENPDDEDSCWMKFNQAFEWLPVAALIENRILCIHGGIGGSIHTLEDISSIMRPLKITQIPSTNYEQRVTDLLWSDPTDNDAMLGVVPNLMRDPDGVGHIVKYGPDIVKKFLSDNNLQLIIRAHECVMDGFERFAGGKLITLFSATNYCNHHLNAGALLFLRRDLTIVPKIIFPAQSSRTFNTWNFRMLNSRPPTPPRQRPKIVEENFGAPQ